MNLLEAWKIGREWNGRYLATENSRQNLLLRTVNSRWVHVI